MNLLDAVSVEEFLCNPMHILSVFACVAGPIDWAFSWIWSRLFAISPKVSREGDQLIAKTSVKASILCLGFGGRSVVIDANRKLVRLRKRTFWFAVRTRFIPFNAIQEVVYGYNDIDPSSGWAWSYQQNDLFTVGLKVQPNEEVLLFRFYGEGDFVNDGPLPDWMYWEDRLEAKISMTNQEGESRAYAELASGLIGVPLGNPAP